MTGDEFRRDARQQFFDKQRDEGPKLDTSGKPEHRPEKARPIRERQGN